MFPCDDHRPRTVVEAVALLQQKSEGKLLAETLPCSDSPEKTHTTYSPHQPSLIPDLQIKQTRVKFKQRIFYRTV